MGHLTATVFYGDKVAMCEVHGGVGTKFGTLVDPNGRKWDICATCINGLWDAAHWANLEQRAEANAEGRLAERLARMLSEGE
jgi:uncharacterized protein with PIN domain